MPLLITLILAAHLLLLWHAVRTGRRGWIPVLFVPVVGAAAYFAGEIAFAPLRGKRTPEPAKHARWQRERRRRLLWPSRKSRDATPVAERLRLAEDALAGGNAEEARDLLESCLIYGARPEILSALARARFALDDPAGTLKALDRLRQEFPDQERAADRALYTRALDARGKS